MSMSQVCIDIRIMFLATEGLIYFLKLLCILAFYLESYDPVYFMKVKNQGRKNNKLANCFVRV
jgi:hypothetical protein